MNFHKTFILSAAFIVATGAQAKSAPALPPDAPPLPDVPPPELTVDITDEPAIVSTRKGDLLEEKFIRRGKVYLIKVTPDNRPPYYMADEEGKGDFVKKDNIDPSMWKPNWLNQPQ
ncbi:DUF2782 domain-containing protein [Leeia sp. TBRC 13508]|uniref:DUF2782 domain-containing protein n=1 Tax=Leeia speluncae TaxID=2884804 RepID=A0ABS8D6X2_9NEIS|nr:DUF2782 domain-containing protein [Leeia speluncae]MCB6183946.1 DUF2782 domain-containing protein [Leeia speluncae]